MEVVIVIAIWIVIWTWLGWWVAGQKNRDIAEGAMLGFLLGPFGVLIEALLPTQKPVAAVQQQSPAAQTNADYQAYTAAADRAWEREQAQLRAEMLKWEQKRERLQAERRQAREQERLEREQTYNAMLKARGLQRGPMVWLWLLPDWLQPMIIGLAVALPGVVAVVYIALK